MEKQRIRMPIIIRFDDLLYPYAIVFGLMGTLKSVRGRICKILNNR